MDDVGTKKIVTVNAGSSSIKLGLFDTDSFQPNLQIEIVNIGQPSGELRLRRAEDAKTNEALGQLDFSAAIEVARERLRQELGDNTLIAIGHRLVHGGPDFYEPTHLDDTTIARLRELIPFDPEHLPAALELAEGLGEDYPAIVQIGCFDTAFFHDLPRVAQLLPLPRKYQAQGLRRYGFHGLSYQSILSNFGVQAGEMAARGRVVIAHLGSGASLTAVIDGKPVDTTMSFTPNSGIPMSTRSGDLDPGVIAYLQKQDQLDAAQTDHLLGFESGLLGVSGTTADMLALLNNEATDSAAADAVNLFCYRVRQAIGSLSTSLGGIDSLIFAGGIGENAPAIRARICEGLTYLGIVLDEARNAATDFLISADSFGVGVHVIHTNESQIIAKTLMEMVGIDKIERTRNGIN